MAAAPGRAAGEVPKNNLAHYLGWWSAQSVEGRVLCLCGGLQKLNADQVPAPAQPRAGRLVLPPLTPIKVIEMEPDFFVPYSSPQIVLDKRGPPAAPVLKSAPPVPKPAMPPPMPADNFPASSASNASVQPVNHGSSLVLSVSHQPSNQSPATIPHATAPRPPQGIWQPQRHQQSHHQSTWQPPAPQRSPEAFGNQVNAMQSPTLTGPDVYASNPQSAPYVAQQMRQPQYSPAAFSGLPPVLPPSQTNSRPPAPATLSSTPRTNPAYAPSTFAYSTPIPASALHVVSQPLLHHPPARDQQQQPQQPQQLPVSAPAVPDEDALQRSTKGRFDWAKVYETNQVVFGHKSFRPGQRTIIHATMTGLDCFSLMPTGAGKSLCYQLPAVMDTSRVSIVISPLVSLVHDQVSSLRACNVEARALTGFEAQQIRGSEDHSYSATVHALKTGRVRLLYTTPEKIAQSESFRSLLRELVALDRVGRFVVDEAHCVSQWGHDFRQDYLRLDQLRRDWPSVPIMALTATASRLVVDDTMRILGLRSNCVTVTLSFDRPNLSYEVRPKGSFAKAIEQLSSVCDRHRGESGIVYCLTRSDCEKVAEALGKHIGPEKVAYYHAGIEDAHERQARQDRWSTDEVSVMVATIAFGMGIDKPHVRYVVHFSLPKSITNLYQESGRAGRDGLASECLVLYTYADKHRIERMIKAGDGDLLADRSQVMRNLDNLNRMVKFCENQVECRRVLLLEYFGESFDRARCNRTCDNCKATGGAVEVVDVTLLAQWTMQCLTAIHTRSVTESLLVRVLCGSQDKDIMNKGLNSAPGYGSCRLSTRDELTRVVHRLVLEDVINEWEKTNGAGYSTVYLSPGSTPLPAKIEMITKTKRGAGTAPKVAALLGNDGDEENKDHEDDDDDVVVVVTAPPSKPSTSATAKATAAAAAQEGTGAAALPPRTGSRLAPAQEKVLYERLKSLASALAKENNISKHFHVWNDRQLIEMSRRVPRSMKELMDIFDVSWNKAESFGNSTLALINEIVAQPGFISNYVQFGEFVFNPRKPVQDPVEDTGVTEMDDDVMYVDGGGVSSSSASVEEPKKRARSLNER